MTVAMDQNVRVRSRCGASISSVCRQLCVQSQPQPYVAIRRLLHARFGMQRGLRLSPQGVDLVIHTAGPFQWKQTCSVLEAAIAAGTPYIDVCDDADYSAVSTPAVCLTRVAKRPACILHSAGPGCTTMFPLPDTLMYRGCRALRWEQHLQCLLALILRVPLLSEG